jgi:hypothetical protein
VLREFRFEDAEKNSSSIQQPDNAHWHDPTLSLTAGTPSTCVRTAAIFDRAFKESSGKEENLSG